ncbi:hypothetical protein CJ739_1447 [Mariniflexile rhizosphaerae]|uniref:hypothetical protein n=1 Tax=unclassified Mariniflexile TaxID=2643887 RepID=UPI000CC66B84|nr:hypothetical protein [Mariniflexile sp. TRM1-10]AXP80536.1 hypothetical protein CJ739_1447 [Mariniflexile sp. TRM1-10]PLB20078.1 MAG: hypothetical protein TRG1_1023 [Flavobacteriaceae bacterium FS1-H7996/R]
MSDKKHIDRLFQEHFKDFEATPSNAVWKNIEAELNQDKKKRRIIPIWWQYAGVAALLALLLTVGGTYFFNKENTNPIKVVDTEDAQTRSSNPSNDTKIAVENDNPVQNSLENDSQNNTKVASNTTKESQEPSIANTSSSTNKNKSTHQSDIASNKKSNIKNSITTSNNHAFASNSEEKNKSTNTAVTNNSENKNETPKNRESLINTEKAKELINNASKDSTAIAKAENKEKNSLTIEEALDSNKDVVENEKNKNKWRITPNAAPIYFNSLGEGSSIDPQFNNNSKTGEVNMSYGISASYVVNDKIKIRSGINKVNLGYNTNNVIVYQSLGVSSSTRDLQNVNVSTSNASDNVSVISGETLNAKPEAFATTNTSINQALGYIEVPLEIQYALVSNKLGVNVIGGFSSFFLSDNKIFSEAEGGTRTFLGEANNINKVSYSANFGVGFNYQVSKKIDLNLEPMFKYQINTFNNTSGNFTPFFIGVYTGFTIKF